MPNESAGARIPRPAVIFTAGPQRETARFVRFPGWALFGRLFGATSPETSQPACLGALSSRRPRQKLEGSSCHVIAVGRLRLLACLLASRQEETMRPLTRATKFARSDTHKRALAFTHSRAQAQAEMEALHRDDGAGEGRRRCMCVCVWAFRAAPRFAPASS